MPSNTITDTINQQLDKIENNLPAFPARVFHLQRSLTNAWFDRTSSVINAVSESTRNLFDVSRQSGRTVTGQARSAAGQVADTARTGARTVSGQAAAQGRRVAKTARNEAEELIDDAINTVESDVDAAQDAVEDSQGTSGRGRRYEDWTKAELLERAKELDIEGRYGMNKGQLIRALRKS